MRHRRDTLKLGRTSSHRKAMFRNMVTSLFKYDRIRTTDVKAKELRRWADQLVTLAKRGDLHARRIALSIIRERDVVQKLFDEAPQRFGAVSGGYTRIVKIGRRPGDAAPVSVIELVAPSGKPVKKEKKPKKAKTTPAPVAAPEAKVEEPVETPEAPAPEATPAETVEATPAEAPEAAAAPAESEPDTPAEAAEESEEPKE